MNLILKIQKFYYMEKYLIDSEFENMENIKVIFIDIDGTLADDQNTISNENKEVLKILENSGISPILCSGRTRNTVEFRSEEIGISSVFICSNGAEIFDKKSQQIIYEKYIKRFIIRFVFKFCQKRNVGIMLRTTTEAYVNKYWESDNYSQIEKIEQVLDKKIVRFKFKVKQIKIIRSLLVFLRVFGIVITTNICEEGNVVIGVSKRKINKGEAIKHYLKREKISKINACAIGNDTNDISMFKAVKYKVAMENAIKELKRKADYITLSNNNNGVSFFIKQKILKGN